MSAVIPSRILNDMDLKCDSCFRHVPEDTLHKAKCAHSYCISCAQEIFLTSINHRQKPYCCGQVMYTAQQTVAMFTDEFCVRYHNLCLEARAERNATPGHTSTTCTKCVEDGSVTELPPGQDRRQFENKDWKEVRARGGIIIDHKPYPRTCPCGARVCIECGKPFNEDDCTCAGQGLGWRAANRRVYKVVYLLYDGDD
ncbi:hypothetical protein F4811DRAFT_554522 [Daldinia bambusicola]|nr:hypothetical protein F4811DRAFT_554522 [Daldinia bambusicola]